MTQQSQESQESRKRPDGMDLFVGAMWGASFAVILAIAVCLSTMPAHIGQATVTTPTMQVTGEVVIRGQEMTVTSDGATYKLTEWSRIERVMQP